MERIGSETFRGRSIFYVNEDKHELIIETEFDLVKNFVKAANGFQYERLEHNLTRRDYILDGEYVGYHDLLEQFGDLVVEHVVKEALWYEL